MGIAEDAARAHSAQLEQAAARKAAQQAEAQRGRQRARERQQARADRFRQECQAWRTEELARVMKWAARLSPAAPSQISDINCRSSKGYLAVWDEMSFKLDGVAMLSGLYDKGHGHGPHWRVRLAENPREIHNLADLGRAITELSGILVAQIEASRRRDGGGYPKNGF